MLSNDRLQLEFLPAHRGELATLAMAVKQKTTKGWQAVDIDPAAEGYFVNVAPVEAKLGFSGFYPTWTRTKVEPFTVEAGGVRVSTVSGRTTHQPG